MLHFTTFRKIMVIDPSENSFQNVAKSVVIPMAQWIIPLYTSIKVQSQKTKGFCVAHFATLSDERGSRSKIFQLFDTDKGTLCSNLKLEGSQVRKSLGFCKLSRFVFVSQRKPCISYDNTDGKLVRSSGNAFRTRLQV